MQTDILIYSQRIGLTAILRQPLQGENHMPKTVSILLAIALMAFLLSHCNFTESPRPHPADPSTLSLAPL